MSKEEKVTLPQTDEDRVKTNLNFLNSSESWIKNLTKASENIWKQIGKAEPHERPRLHTTRMSYLSRIEIFKNGEKDTGGNE